MIERRFAVEVYLVGQEDDDPLATYWWSSGSVAVPAVGEQVTIYPERTSVDQLERFQCIVDRREWSFAESALCAYLYVRPAPTSGEGQP